MKIQLALVFSVFATAAGFADVGDNITSLTTLSGKTYRGVLIAQVNPDGVFFRHANGAGKVLFSDLPSDVRQSLGYDLKKAETYQKELTARRERERLACIARDKEIAKAQAAAFTTAAAQANLIQAQYAVAASQASYGYNTSYPVVYGYGMGYGWNTGRIPSPGYGGRAYYTVRRQANATGLGGHPFSAGQISNGPPYSPGHVGTARFTSGVPALNSSFAPAHAGSHHPVVTGTGTRPIGPASPVAKGR